MKLENSYVDHHLLTEPKFGRAKRIKIWINGESSCHEISFNPKNFRSWTSILFHITETIKPNFGAVRKLVALSTLKVIDCFENLDQDEKYVALGVNCRLKIPQGGYNNNLEKQSNVRQKVKKKLYAGEVNSKKLPFLIETGKKKLTIVYMTVNGRTAQVPQKVVFKENEMRNWDVIFNYLSNILDIPEGVENICTIFGDILEDPSHLQHGFLYVAVPFKEHFVKIDYLSLFKTERNPRSTYTLSITPGNDSSTYQSIPRKKKKLFTLSSNGSARKSIRKYDQEESPKSPSLKVVQQKTLPEVHREIHSAPLNNEILPVSAVHPTINKVLPLALRIKEEIANSIKAYEQSIVNIEKQIFAEREKYKLQKSKTIVDSGTGCSPTHVDESGPRNTPDELQYSGSTQKSETVLKKSRGKTTIDIQPQNDKSIRATSSDESKLLSTGTTVTLKSRSASRPDDDNKSRDDKSIRATSSDESKLLSTGTTVTLKSRSASRPDDDNKSRVSDSASTCSTFKTKIKSEECPIDYNIQKNISDIKEVRSLLQNQLAYGYDNFNVPRLEFGDYIPNNSGNKFHPDEVCYSMSTDSIEGLHIAVVIN